jgi:Fe-S cluster assembly ATP-binding protein
MKDEFLVNNLRATIDGKEILHGVSFRIKRGEIHAVMGQNGSGKSTLAYALMGHPGYKVTSGTVRLEKDNQTVDLLTLPADLRAKRGLFLSFQNPVAIPGVSVFQLLKSSSESAGERQYTSVLDLYAKLQEEAQGFGLAEEFLRRSLNDGFSGGEKKKMEMLQLAVLRPKFAILDEVDTGLDLDAIKTVAKGIRKIASDGTGILLITHYPKLLQLVKPDKVHIFIDGNIVASGTESLVKEVEKYGYQRFTGHPG